MSMREIEENIASEEISRPAVRGSREATPLPIEELDTSESHPVVEINGLDYDTSTLKFI